MKRILLIEDDSELASTVRQRLGQAGFDVNVASEGYQGVQMAHATSPDLILLDLILPTGNGLTVLKRIRLSTKTSQIPVIVLTAMNDMFLKEDVMRVGVDAYLEKPCSGDDLVKTINTVLEAKS